MSTLTFRKNENVSWKVAIKKIFDLIDDAVEDYGLYLLSTGESVLLNDFLICLGKSSSQTLSARQQEVVLKIRAEIRSTCLMLRGNAVDLKKCPHPQQLHVTQELRRCHSAGMHF